MLWDTHIHTWFSGDCDTDPEAMILACKEKGLQGICITDHHDDDYMNNSERFLLDFDRYMPYIQALSHKYEGTFSICVGVEVGLQPQLREKLKALTKKYPFDFIVGSSHMVNGIDPFDKSYFYGKTEDEAYEEYFRSIYENVAALDEFDVYGHLDFVVRYGPNTNQYYSYQKYADIIDEGLRVLIQKGKGIEINTSGFKYRLGHPHPTEDIIRRYRELGGEIITIGSDAHIPDHVAYDFHKVPEILKNAGFRYYTVFKERRPEFIRLD